MAAKPRVTVRLAPSTLHALAYIAERDKLAPAEAARMMVSAQVRAILEGRGWAADQQQLFRDWERAHATDGAPAPVARQEDYDQLAAGALPAGPASHALRNPRS